MIGFYMSKKIAAIYIPGIGDQKTRGQDKAIQLLRLFGIKPYYFAFGWADGSKDFNNRLDELLKEIDSLNSRGYKVSLVAASAGASGALNVFAKRKDIINSVSLICGKVHNLESIGSAYLQRNPKFADNIKLLPESMGRLDTKDGRRIMSIRPVRDGVVPPEDTIIDGARNIQSFTFGHSTTIAHYLTVGLPRIAWWIRKNS